jgi:hypothetical protein
MRFHSPTLSRLLAVAALVFSPLTLAEQAISDGRYEIHYNAFNKITWCAASTGRWSMYRY